MDATNRERDEYGKFVSDTKYKPKFISPEDQADMAEWTKEWLKENKVTKCKHLSTK